MVRKAARAQVALLAALAFSGCLGDDSSGPASIQGAGVGAPLQLADCDDWNAADPRQRSHTIGDLRAFAGGPTGSPGRRGATLSDDRAYRVLDNYCRQDFAHGFKLYKLYTRAAAFRKLAPE